MTQGLSDVPAISVPSGGSVFVKTAFATIATTSLTNVVAAVAGKRLKIWEFCVQAETLSSIYFASNSTPISQTVKLAAYGSWIGEPIEIYEQNSPALLTNVGEALSLKQNTTGPTNVWVKYTEED